MPTSAVQLLSACNGKLMDSSRLHSLGWQAKVALETGLAQAYADFCKPE